VINICKFAAGHADCNTVSDTRPLMSELLLRYKVTQKCLYTCTQISNYSPIKQSHKI